MDNLKGSVKDFVDSYDQALEKIKSYNDGLALLSGEDYLKLVKKRGNLEFYSINWRIYKRVSEKLIFFWYTENRKEGAYVGTSKVWTKR